MKRLRRWLRLRRGFVGRPKRPTVLGFAKAFAPLAVAVTLFASPAVAFYQQPGLNGVASMLAGRKVAMRCMESQEENMTDFTIGMGAAAYVEGRNVGSRWVPSSYAVVAYPWCGYLVDWMSRQDARGKKWEDVVWAVLVITHESGHLKGARWAGDEAKTQCWAMQHLPAAARMLGFTEDQLPFVVWQANKIHREWMPDEYQLPGCRLPTP